MRGILSSWMRQSKKLEAFKKHQSPENALHVKFHLNTGAEIFPQKEYNHLQV